MPTLADPATREWIISRIDTLNALSTAAWGKFTLDQMLTHCSDGLRMGYGELAVQTKNMWLARLPLMKWLAIDKLKWPQGSPTAPELLARTTHSWEAERAELIALIRRFPDDVTRGTWPRHPAFGTLTGAQWGRLAWKHMDHHLRQFRV